MTRTKSAFISRKMSLQCTLTMPKHDSVAFSLVQCFSAVSVEDVSSSVDALLKLTLFFDYVYNIPHICRFVFINNSFVVLTYRQCLHRFCRCSRVFTNTFVIVFIFRCLFVFVCHWSVICVKSNVKNYYDLWNCRIIYRVEKIRQNEE